MKNLLAVHRCQLTGWLLAWAAFTFLSAAVRAYQTASIFPDTAEFAPAVWQIADAVPPAGKLSFGGLLAISLIALHLSTRPFGLPRLISDIVAGTVTVAIVIGLLPVGYYPDSFLGAWLQPHLLCGAAAGLLCHLMVRRCEARRRSPKG